MDAAELPDAVPAPPAPGYHDSKAFPELDHQRIPDDIPAAAAEEMDRANSPEDHAREQASLRLPAQAGGDDQVQLEELPKGRAREQASPRLPAQAGGDGDDDEFPAEWFGWDAEMDDPAEDEEKSDEETESSFSRA